MTAAENRKRVREAKRRQGRPKSMVAKLAEEVQSLADLPDPPERDEILKLLGVQARDGHVQAMRLLLEEQRREASDQEQPTDSVIDELLAQRRARVSTP